ncbi:hypothetical protein M885DRAFT_524800 [Pelagophyceae sp. CCMP2097]|nr:hypothetical protein M885DRAFT_524800 [Pelagophyceae sp. CCMP2097]
MKASWSYDDMFAAEAVHASSSCALPAHEHLFSGSEAWSWMRTALGRARGLDEATRRTSRTPFVETVYLAQGAPMEWLFLNRRGLVKRRPAAKLDWKYVFEHFVGRPMDVRRALHGLQKEDANVAVTVWLVADKGLRRVGLSVHDFERLAALELGSQSGDRELYQWDTASPRALDVRQRLYALQPATWPRLRGRGGGVFVAAYGRARPQPKVSTCEMNDELPFERVPRGLVAADFVGDRYSSRDVHSHHHEHPLSFPAGPEDYAPQSLVKAGLAVVVGGALAAKLDAAARAWVGMLQRAMEKTLTSLMVEFVFDAQGTAVLLACRSVGLLAVSRPNLLGHALKTVAGVHDGVLRDESTFEQRLGTSRSQPLFFGPESFNDGHPRLLAKKARQRLEAHKSTTAWQPASDWQDQSSSEKHYDALLLQEILQRNALPPALPPRRTSIFERASRGSFDRHSRGSFDLTRPGTPATRPATPATPARAMFDVPRSPISVPRPPTAEMRSDEESVASRRARRATPADLQAERLKRAAAAAERADSKVDEVTERLGTALENARERARGMHAAPENVSAADHASALEDAALRLAKDEFWLPPPVSVSPARRNTPSRGSFENRPRGDRPRGSFDGNATFDGAQGLDAAVDRRARTTLG